MQYLNVFLCFVKMLLNSSIATELVVNFLF